MSRAMFRGGAIVSLVVAVALVLPVPVPAEAHHSGAGYHWPRSKNPVAIVVVDRTVSGSEFNRVVAEAVRSWSAGPVRLSLQRDGRTDCGEVAGAIVVCAGTFLAELCGGASAWAGCAAVTVDESTRHIASAGIKLNVPVLRFGLLTGGPSIWLSQEARVAVYRTVVQQELGHALGLEHSVERSSVMFPLWDPREALTRSIGRHDFDTLRAAYAHNDHGSSPRGGRGRYFAVRFR